MQKVSHNLTFPTDNYLDNFFRKPLAMKIVFGMKSVDVRARGYLLTDNTRNRRGKANNVFFCRFMSFFTHCNPSSQCFSGGRDKLLKHNINIYAIKVCSNLICECPPTHFALILAFLDTHPSIPCHTLSQMQIYPTHPSTPNV